MFSLRFDFPSLFCMADTINVRSRRTTEQNGSSIFNFNTLLVVVWSGSNHFILLQLFSSSPIYLRYAWLMGKFSIPFFASRIARMMEGDENFRISNFNSFVSAFFTFPIRSSLSGTSRPFGTRTELELVRCSWLANPPRGRSGANRLTVGRAFRAGSSGCRLAASNVAIFPGCFGGSHVKFRSRWLCLTAGVCKNIVPNIMLLSTSKPLRSKRIKIHYTIGCCLRIGAAGWKKLVPSLFVC